MRNSSSTLLHGDWVGTTQTLPSAATPPSASPSSALSPVVAVAEFLAEVLDHLGKALKVELVTLEITQPLRIKICRFRNTSRTARVKISRKRVFVTLDVTALNKARGDTDAFSNLIDALLYEVTLAATRRSHPFTAHLLFLTGVFAATLFTSLALLATPAATYAVTTCLIVPITVISMVLLHSELITPHLQQFQAGQLLSSFGYDKTHALLKAHPEGDVNFLHQALQHQAQTESKQAATLLVRQVDQADF